jgi:hypothetical protein
MSSFDGLFGRLPGRRAAQERTYTRRKSLAGLEFALAELVHDLQMLAELSHTAEEDGATPGGEAAIASRIREVLAGGERFASALADDEAARAWRELVAGTTNARLLERGARGTAELRLAAARCEQLQQFVDQEIAEL